MAQSAYERVVARAFQYVALAGRGIDADITHLILQIVEAEISAGDEQLLARVLDRLSQQLRPLPPVPSAAPPLQRASIGYR